MIGTPLKKIKKQLGLRSSGSVIYGEYMGYTVTFSQQNGLLSLCVDVYFPDESDEARKRILEFVDSVVKQYNYKFFEVKKSGIKIDFADRPGIGERVLDLFYALATELSSIGVKGSSVCSNCGKPSSSLKFLRLGNFVHSCDEECAGKILNSANSSAPSPTTKHHNFSFGSLFGAFIGALIGGGVMLWTSTLFDFYYYSAVFIPIFSSLLYFLFGGKNSLAKQITVSLFSVLFMVLSCFAIFTYFISQNWNLLQYTYTMKELLDSSCRVLVGSGFAQSIVFLRHVLLCGVFTLIGLILSIWRRKKAPCEQYAEIIG